MASDNQFRLHLGDGRVLDRADVEAETDTVELLEWLDELETNAVVIHEQLSTTKEFGIGDRQWATRTAHALAWARVGAKFVRKRLAALGHGDARAEEIARLQAKLTILKSEERKREFDRLLAKIVRERVGEREFADLIQATYARLDQVPAEIQQQAAA